MNTIRDCLAKNLKELRKARGLTQEGLAEASGMTSTNVAHIETNRVWPSPNSISAIAAALGVSEAALFTAATADAAAPTRDSLLAGILTRVPALHDDQLRALFNIVDGFARDNAETEVPKQLARKKN